MPVAIDLIAAELAQQRHEFDAARRSLDRVLAAQPRQLEARLMRANIGLLTGEFDAARDATASPFFRLARPIQARSAWPRR